MRRGFSTSDPLLGRVNVTHAAGGSSSQQVGFSFFFLLYVLVSFLITTDEKMGVDGISSCHRTMEKEITSSLMP